jgi:hypothetical protein
MTSKGPKAAFAAAGHAARGPTPACVRQAEMLSPFVCLSW